MRQRNRTAGRPRRWLRERRTLREEGCAGCCHWRPLRGMRAVFACHYCLDTGQTRVRRGPGGETLLPAQPCPRYRRDEDYARRREREYRRWADVLFSPGEVSR